MPEQRIEDRIALPGDPDLDCMLTGLRLASMVATETGEYDVEVTLDFDTSEAAGWWIDEDGEQVFPDRVTKLEITYGVVMDEGFEHLAERMTERLGAWGKDRALIAMTSAPGKWTLLRCPGHPAGEQMAIPRSARDA